MKPTPPVFYVKTHLHIVTANRDRNCKANWTFICFLPAATQDRERWPVPVEPLWEERAFLFQATCVAEPESEFSRRPEALKYVPVWSRGRDAWLSIRLSKESRH